MWLRHQRLTNSNALREYKQKITLNPIQKDVIVGTLLGDASIPLDRGKPMWRSHPRCVSDSNKILQGKTIYGIYMTFLKTRSGDFVGTPPRVRNNSGGGARPRQSIWFKTYSHPELKFYDSLFYLDYKYKVGLSCSRKKRVPDNISELLTPRAVAYWFMDDGDSYQKSRNLSYRFSTKRSALFHLGGSINTYTNFTRSLFRPNGSYYSKFRGIYYIFGQNLLSV